MLYFTIILILLQETAKNFRQNKIMTIPSSELLTAVDQIIESMSWTQRTIQYKLIRHLKLWQISATLYFKVSLLQYCMYLLL